MADRWDGNERRAIPPEQIIRAAVRDEIEQHMSKLNERVETVERKLDRWESNGILLRWIVIAFAAVLSQLTGFLRWIKEHIA